MEDINNTINPKKSFRIIGLALLLACSIMLSSEFVLALLSNKFGIVIDYSTTLGWILSYIPIYIVAIPLCIFIICKCPKDDKKGIVLSFKEFITYCVICFPIMYSGSLIGLGFSWLISKGQAVNPVEEVVLSDVPLKIIITVILAPILEELLFRKVIIDHTSLYGEKMAIFFSALAFGLFHTNFFQFFYAFGLGLVFGYIYVRTKRIRYTIIIHMLINFIGSVISPYILSVTNNLTDYNNIDFSLIMVALFGYLIIFLFIIGICLLISKRKKITFNLANYELNKGNKFKTVFLNVFTILFVLICISFSIFVTI